MKGTIRRQYEKLSSMGLKNYFRYMFLENRSDEQTIFKNTFWLFLAEGVNGGLMFLLTIIIARYLGTEGYGQFAFAMSFTALFAVVADFGLSTLTIREVARDKKLAKKYIDNVSVLKLFLGVVTFALIFIIIQFMGKSQEVRILVYLFGVYIILKSFNDFLRSFFKAFQEMQYETISRVIKSTTLLIFVVIGVALNVNLVILILSYLLSSIISLLYNLKTIKKTKIKLKKIKFSILKKSWPFALSMMLVVIYMKCDVLMLSFIKGDAATGIYSAMYDMIYSILIVPAIFYNSLFPLTSKLYNENRIIEFRKIIKKNYLINIIFSVFIIIIFNLFYFQITELIFGKEFLAGAKLFGILSFAIGISSISHVNLLILNSINKEKIYLISTILASIINIILNFTLIPRYSYFGAAYATITAEIIGFTYCLFFIIKYLKKWQTQKLV